MPSSHDSPDFRREREAIQAEFDETLLHASPDYRAVSQGIITRSGLRAGQNSLKWADQFSTLVLLYPTHQASCLEGLGRSLVRSANVAHLCFLVHTFVDDRHRDGQVKLSDVESRFVNDLVPIGCTILETLPIQGSKLSAEARIVEDTRNQLLDVRASAFDFLYDVRERALSLVAIDRAILGYFSTATLVGLVRSDLDVSLRLVQAYFLLVLGMQWIDDTEDWKEDLALGDSNLLLESLKSRKMIKVGRRPFSTTMRDISRVLSESDALDYAILRADTCFGCALTIQAELGCNQLTKQLKILRKRLVLARQRLKRSEAEEFSSASSIDVSDSLRQRDLQVSNRAICN